MDKIEEYLSKGTIHKKYWKILKQNDGYITILQRFQKIPLKEVITPGGSQRFWEETGLFFRDTHRPYQALLIFKGLYERMFKAQANAKSHQHKAMPLVWMADMYNTLGYRAHARRYAMLTLCEDAITDEGKLNVSGGGIYFRLSWQYGMSDKEIHRYAQEAFNAYRQLGNDAWYPERILLELDNHWMVDSPAPQELFHYIVNPHFIRNLLGGIGKSRGKSLELLSQYLVSCIPGVRTYLNEKTPSTDYDVVCTFEGIFGDFRDELGRYVICECKDWSKKINYTTVAKFCRVLDSAKCRAGFLFSRHGITGEKHTTDAARERLKVFQDRGLVIICLSLDDIRKIEQGENLIPMIRSRYESVRLDIRKEI